MAGISDYLQYQLCTLSPKVGFCLYWDVCRVAGQFFPVSRKHTVCGVSSCSIERAPSWGRTFHLSGPRPVPWEGRVKRLREWWIYCYKGKLLLRKSQLYIFVILLLIPHFKFSSYFLLGGTCKAKVPTLIFVIPLFLIILLLHATPYTVLARKPFKLLKYADWSGIMCLHTTF